MQRRFLILATTASFIACQPNCDDREIAGPDDPVGTSDDDDGVDDDDDQPEEYCDLSEFAVLQPQWLDRREARLPGAREYVDSIVTSEDALFVVDHPSRPPEYDLSGHLERRTLAGEFVWEVELDESPVQSLALDDEHVYLRSADRVQRWTVDGEPDEWRVETSEYLIDMSVGDTVAVLENQSRDTGDLALAREVTKDLPQQEIDSLVIEAASGDSVSGAAIAASPWGGWVVGTLELTGAGTSQVGLVTMAADVDVDVKLAFEAGIPYVQAMAVADGQLVVAGPRRWIGSSMWLSRIADEAGGRELSRHELSLCESGAGNIRDIVAHNGSFWVFGWVEVAPSAEHDDDIPVLVNVDYDGEVLGRYRVELEGRGWDLHSFAKTDQGMFLGGHQRRADGEFDRVIGRLER